MYGADHDVSSCLSFEFIDDGQAIGVVEEDPDRQENEFLEFSQIRSFHTRVFRIMADPTTFNLFHLCLGYLGKPERLHEKDGIILGTECSARNASAEGGFNHAPYVHGKGQKKKGGVETALQVL